MASHDKDFRWNGHGIQSCCQRKSNWTKLCPQCAILVGLEENMILRHRIALDVSGGASKIVPYLSTTSLIELPLVPNDCLADSKLPMPVSYVELALLTDLAGVKLGSHTQTRKLQTSRENFDCAP